MFSYTAFGLAIQSTLPLPEYLASRGGSDVHVYLKCADKETYPLMSRPFVFNWTPREAEFAVERIGVFRIREGREITVTRSPNADEQLVRTYIVGMAMGLLLNQRGILPLHGSTVDVAGSAVTFFGASGSGKSTMAASLVRRGHRLVADDITAVEPGALPIRVFPAFPQLKVTSQIAALLGYDVEKLVDLHEQERNQGLRLVDDFSPHPIPLGLVYVLEDGPVCNITPLSSKEALLELIRHSYPTTLLQSGGAPHFLACSEVAREVPIYRLQRPRDPSALPDLAAIVEQHIRGRNKVAVA